MAKNYYTLDQAFGMVAADSNSGSKPKYSEPKFSDSDDDMGQVQPPLQKVQSSRDIVDIVETLSGVVVQSGRDLMEKKTMCHG